MTTNIKQMVQTKKLDRSKQPKPGKPKDVNFPKFFETSLDNGIMVLVIEDNRLPIVTSRFVFKSGSYLDFFSGSEKSGLASLTAELLVKGTAGMNATQVAQEIDFYGASLSSGSDPDASYVSSHSLKKYFDNIFDVMSDVILEPEFAEEEISRQKEQRMNSLLSMTDDGEYLAEKTFRRFVFGNTPYAFPTEGMLNTIDNISRNDIAEFYKKVYRPQNLIVAFVGAISPDEAMLKLNERFAKWKTNDYEQEKIILPEDSGKVKVLLSEKSNAVQSSLRLGHLGVPRNHPDFIPIQVLNTLFGGYFTSRINKNLREKNGYTYGARSNFIPYKHSGEFYISTEVKNDITANAIAEVLNELNIIRREPIPEEELQNVKNYVSGNFPLQLETPNAVASKVINLKFFGLEDDYYNKFIRNVNELSAQDIHDAANKYLHPDSLTISVAGNTVEIADSMKQFGDVKVVDDES